MKDEPQLSSRIYDRVESKRLLALPMVSAALIMTCCMGYQETKESPAKNGAATELSDPEFADFSAKLTDVERVRFKEFLTAVSCNEIGCSVGDVAFENRSKVAEYFVEYVLHDHEKGLVVANSRKFTGTVTVCWTADSNATAAQKAAVIANVEATWKAYANINFDWYSSGTTPRSCDQTQAPSYNVKIWQDTSQTRGCAYVGKNTAVGIACSGSVSHAYANMLLEAGQGSLRDDYVAVHEFGHAIGIYHEQDREPTICTSGTAALATGAQLVGPYDPESIMNYCAPSSAYISFGDTQSAAFLYDGRSTNPTFRSRSWIPTDVEFTVLQPNGTSSSATQTSVTLTDSDLAFGATQTASTVTVVPTDTTLVCGLRSVAPNLRDRTNTTLFSSSTPIPAECYSPALVVAVLL